MQKRSLDSIEVWFLDGPKVIEELKKRAENLVAKDSRVDSVILFGSLAKGNYTARSDADLCIVLKQDDRERPMDRIPEFLHIFVGAGVPVDVLVYTRAEIDQMRSEGRRFVTEALAEGITLAEHSV